MTKTGSPDQKEVKGTDRRDFLKTSLTAMLFTGCFAAFSRAEAKALLATAREAGLPVMSESALNAYIQAIPKANRTREAQAASGNLLGYLRAHFTLAPNQVAYVNALTAAQMNALRAAMSDSIQHDKAFQVSIPPPAPTARAKTRGNPPPSNSGSQMTVNNTATVNVVTINK